MQNANGIDKVDLYCLRFAVKYVGKVPVPPVKREIYDYERICSMEGDGRKILFFIMKVKLNVKICKTDEDYTAHVNKMKNYEKTLIKFIILFLFNIEVRSV